MWIKSNGVTYNVRASKWTLRMTSEGELNPQQGLRRSVSSRYGHCTLAHPGQGRRILHCVVHGGLWVFPDTVLAVLGFAA